MEKLINFVQEHLPNKDREAIEEFIAKHRQYGTLDYAIDTEENIVAFVRWNVDGDIWHILDFAVRPDFRNKGVGTDLILRGLERFPDGKYIRFKRGIRKDERFKVLSISRIIKRRIL